MAALGLFVQLDVDYQDDPKIIAAGPMGEALYVRSLALAKRTLSDGVIDATQLPRLALGLQGRPAVIAGKLVDVGLWTAVGNGWVITAWPKRNKTRAEVVDKVERGRAASLKANHEHWHVDRDKPSESCALCYPVSDPIGIRIGSASESTETETEPKEETESEPSSSSCAGDIRSGPDTHPAAAAAAQRGSGEADSKITELAAMAVEVRFHQAKGKVTNPVAWRRALYDSMTLEYGGLWQDQLREHPDADLTAIVASTLHTDLGIVRLALVKARQHAQPTGRSA